VKSKQEESPEMASNSRKHKYAEKSTGIKKTRLKNPH